MSNMVKLRDLCLRITDGSHYSPPAAEAGYPMLSSKDMEDTDFDYSNVKYISEEEYKKMVSSGCKPQKNDVLIIKDGNSYLQKVFVVTEDKEIALLSSIGIIRPDLTKLDPYYLRYYLLSDFVKHEVAKKYVTGSALPRIILQNFGDIDIPYVSLPEQKRVVSVLKDIDSKISINKSAIVDLNAMSKLLYDYWFVQFDFPDEHGKPYKSSGGRMEWNAELKREIPAGWNAQKISELITTERGISYSTPNIQSGKGVPMLNLATFWPGGGDYKSDGLKYFLGEYPKSKVLAPYDLVMCNTQQTAIKFETDIIGRAMLVPDIFDGDVVFSHHVNVIRPAISSLKYYLLYLFNSDYFHKYIAGFTNGTNILGLSFNGVEDYKVEIPPTVLLEKFGEVILSVEKKKSAIIKENSQLASLRDFLLPMLMNGQVKVSTEEAVGSQIGGAPC